MALANKADQPTANGYLVSKGHSVTPNTGSDRNKRATVTAVDNSYGNSDLQVKFDDGKVAVYRSTTVDYIR